MVRMPLLALITAYLIVGGLFATFTPPWQAPDEPAHYNYIRQLAQAGCCPVIASGDWNSAYLELLKSNRFRQPLLGSLESIQYEDHQPPLYYLLLTPVYWLTNGSLIALRLISVLLGAGIVWCAAQIGLMVVPRRPAVALAGAALVAFLPQHIAILSAVNNDSLGNLIVAVGLLLALRYQTDDRVKPWQLGFVVGIGLLTKLSTLLLIPVMGLALLLRWWSVKPRRPQALVYAAATFAVPALLLGGLWMIRNISVYGFPDIFGLGAHDRIVADQPRTAERIAALGLDGYLREALQTTFNSFWGQFGWMGVPMPGWVYTLIGLLLALALIGLIISLLLRFPAAPALPPARLALLLGWAVLLAVAQYLYYNTEFLQFQGRYMFPGLIPFALLLAVGIDGWRRGVERFWRRPPAALAYITTLPFLAFALLDVYLLWRVIVPALSP